MKKLFFRNRIFLPVAFFALSFFLVLPVFAEMDFSSTIDVTEVDYRPQITVDIGGFSGRDSFAMPSKVSCPDGDESCVSINWLANYIAVIYQYGIGVAGILSAVMILVGGFIWLTSFGSPDRITKAKEFIIGALTGLLLALFSYLILFTLNPNLVENEPLIISGVKPQNMFCCKQSDNTYTRESIQVGKNCASNQPPVDDALCKTKKEICEEERKGIYVSATTMLATDLNVYCEEACKKVDSTMKIVEEYSRAEDQKSASGCCICQAKNDIGCCFAPAAPISRLTGGMVGINDEWACTTRFDCLNFSRANMSFKEINGECSIEYCKTLNYE